MTTATLVLERDRSASSAFFQAFFQWDSLLFAFICLADMFTTLYWVHHGAATEANPMLARCLQQGDGMFCFVKILSFLPLLCIAAWHRPKQPKFIAIALRAANIAYVVLYVIGVGSEFIH